MRQLTLKPEIFSFDMFAEFAQEFQIGPEDLIITNEYILGDYLKTGALKASVYFQERCGMGEPSDQMVQQMYEEISNLPPYRRVIGIGGGTVLDLSKLFALKHCDQIEQLFQREIPIEKEKEVILIPTTCGTGSEVTNISILAFVEKQMKLGLAADELYADKAVLIPEFLEHLPYQVFAASSVDALIHAMESSLSPKATPYTKLFGYRAMEMILQGYQTIALQGEEARIPLLKTFLLASNYAGIAFGTAGCGPVHALSYPLGGTFHVPHGVANYTVLQGVLEYYLKYPENKNIRELENHLAEILTCRAADAFYRLERLLQNILEKKTLQEYGADVPMLESWSREVEESQQRLLKNSPVPLTQTDIFEIYKNIF